jgi:hypothetical protein
MGRHRQGLLARLRLLAWLAAAGAGAGVAGAAIITALIEDTRWTLPFVTFCAGAVAGLWFDRMARARG